MRLNRPAMAAVALAVSALLAACGGGGGGTPAANAGNGPAQAELAVTVVDGPIQGAKVCLDRNANGVCDAGEPSGTTNAAGKVTFAVDAADVGKFPVIAEVGADAVDADNPGVKVGTPFVLKAPADRQAVVSPLTTLVQATLENTGGTTADAEASLKAQIGVSGSLFDDFTQSTAAEPARLATLARVLVATTQEQTRQLAGAVGTTALDGATVGQRDVDRAVQQRLLEALPVVVATLADPRLDTANKGAVISTLAQELVASPSVGLNTTTLATLVAAARSPDTSTETPTASGNLRELSFTNAANWLRRAFTTSAAQAVPDAGGMTIFVDRRERRVNGNTATWSFSGDPTRQSDFHFNGTAWVQCGFNLENRTTVRDAQGRASYDYCDKFETGSSYRTAQDVAGKSMADVYQQIRDAGYTNVTIADPATALGTATFPANAKLFHHVSTALTTAVAYVPNLSSGQVRNVRADVAAGGNGTAACQSIQSSTPFENYSSRAQTLESIVAANRGTPCVFGTNTATGPRNEWWSQSTLSVGQVGNAPLGTTTSTYTTNALLRVAFGDGNVARYYSCQQRASDGSTRNCDLVGTGTYAISTLGDARVLRLTNEPAQFLALSYQRVFVERGGQVFFGYQNRPVVSTTARLNLVAMNALSAQLGLPTVDPEVPMAKTAGSYVGDWFVSDAAPLDLASGQTIRITFAGTAANCQNSGETTTRTCTVSITPATGAFTFTDVDGTATGTLNSAASTASGTFTSTGGAPITFQGIRR